jgi:hypothetical protein
LRADFRAHSQVTTSIVAGGDPLVIMDVANDFAVNVANGPVASVLGLGGRYLRTRILQSALDVTILAPLQNQSQQTALKLPLKKSYAGNEGINTRKTMSGLNVSRTSYCSFGEG